uniref:Uncharacterized protein n=1 Tax=Chenopodium quinoa TaxID=63459 RepID=A0A803MEV6_CHEQI
MRRGIQNLETGSVKTSATAPQTNQEQQKSGKESEKIPKQSKSLRPRALPDWPLDIDFDDKAEEDEHGQKMSLLELWIKTHTGKDGSFLPSTVTEDFVDDVKAKVEELRMMHPKMSEQELEDEAFQQTMYGNEIPDRPVGYGLGVKKWDIFGVRGV